MPDFRQLIEQAETELRKTTISYASFKARVAKGVYEPKDGSTTAWGKAFAALAAAKGQLEPPPPPAGMDWKGYSPGGSFAWFSDTEREEELTAMRAAGVKWCRIDLAWSVFEPSKGNFQWAVYDKAVAAAKAHGMKVLGLITYAPSWASGVSGSDKHPPLLVANYGAAVKAAHQHFSFVDVPAFELWNEPNLQGFWGTGLKTDGPERLAAMAKAAREAVGTGRLLVNGGLSPADSTGNDLDPREYLVRYCKAGGGQAVDAIGFHPYYGPNPIDWPKDWNAWTQMYVSQGTAGKGEHGGTMSKPSLRQTMELAGIGAKKIWATETNMVVQPGHVIDGFDATEQRQADLLKVAVAQWRAFPWSGPFFLYNYQRDYPRYSLRRTDGTLRPAYNVYKEAS